MSEITSVADIVRVHGVGRADRECLALGERRLTWVQVYERAQRVANGFAAAGVGAQDRVAFLDKNGVEHFDVFFGASLLNAVCVDVNWRLAAPEVEYIVNDAEATVLVVGPDFVGILDAIAGLAAPHHADPRDRRSRGLPGLRGLARRAAPRRPGRHERT
jgi:long-chain acyl-CoA synthetase